MAQTEARYRIVAEYADGTRVPMGPEQGYQNVFVAHGAASMLLDCDPSVVRVYFQCLDGE